MSIKDTLLVGFAVFAAAYLLYKRAAADMGAPIKNFGSWLSSVPGLLQVDDPLTPEDESLLDQPSLLGDLGFDPLEDDPATAVDESQLGFWGYLWHVFVGTITLKPLRDDVSDLWNDDEEEVNT